MNIKKRFTEEQIIPILKEVMRACRLKRFAGSTTSLKSLTLVASKPWKKRTPTAGRAYAGSRSSEGCAEPKVLTVENNRQAVCSMVLQARVSERKACSVIGLSRATLRYQPKPSLEDPMLSDRIRSIAYERRRFGYRRVHQMLRREGTEVNHKKVYPLYREAGLAVRKRKRKRHHGVMVERQPLMLPEAPNHTWSMDFVMDALATGRRIKCLTIVDDFTKECLDIPVAMGISGNQVVRTLDAIAAFRGYPKAIRTDQGPEFTSKVLDQWAYDNGVELKLIQPGKPTGDQNRPRPGVYGQGVRSMGV